MFVLRYCMQFANSAPEIVSYPAMSIIDEMQMRSFECKDVYLSG